MSGPHVGDWADHKSGTLDPRRVAKVKRQGSGWRVWLNFRASEPDKMFGPMPAGNYTYRSSDA